MPLDKSALNLIILPGLSASVLPDGNVAVTEKFYDGVMKYASFWSGSLTVMMQANYQNYYSQTEKYIILQPDKIPFELKIIFFKDFTPAKLQNKSSVVLASTEFEQNHISQLCRSANIPCIYVAEYSLKTRKQMIAATTNNPFLGYKKKLWEDNQEKKQRQAIALAQGVQCNGVPTYKSYREINPNPLLFFDSRITEDMMATKEDVEKRYYQRKDNQQLRLLYSGRLIKIKGTDHLIKVAQELKKMGIKFQLFICGDGDLKNEMQHQIKINQLNDCVQMLGSLDFKTELIPLVKTNIDLFICCHQQGDPSCTYLETMSCGVPIIGYANEALEELVSYAKIGWITPMNQPKLLAQKVAELAQNLDEIYEMSIKSLTFAELHTFDKTFKKRIDHIERIALNS